MGAKETGQKLHDLSEKCNSANMAELLDDLAKSLTSGDDRERWAHVDLFGAFLGDGGTGAEKAGGGRVRSVLEHLPSILMFLPILVTWIGLAFATVAYRASLADRRLTGQPFLQRWEGGFAGRLPRFLGFETFALATVGAIVLLLAAVLLQAVMASTAKRRERDAAAYRAELAAVLVAADLELAPERRGVQGDLGARMRTLAEEVDQATAAIGGSATAIKEAGEAVEHSHKDATTALRELRAATGALQQAASAVDDATGRAGDAATEVSGELGRLSAACRDLAGATATTGTAMAEAGDRMGTRLSGAATEFADRLRAATDGNQRAFSSAVDSSAARIAGALDDGTGRVGEALAEIRTTGAAYTHRVEEAADLLARAQESLWQMAETARRLGDGLAAVNEGHDRIMAVLSGLDATIKAAGGTAAGGADDGDIRETLRRLDARLAEADEKDAGLTTVLGELRTALEGLRPAPAATDRGDLGAALAKLTATVRDLDRTMAARPPGPRPRKGVLARLRGA